MTRAAWVTLAILALLVLAGSLLLAMAWLDQDGFVDSEQTDQGPGPGAMLALGQPVGQTFVARHSGLSGIEFFLLSANEHPLTLTLHLRTDIGSGEDLVTVPVQLPADAAPRFYRFSFPPLDDSHGQYYYAFLEAPSGVSVAMAGGEAYLDGAAYQSHQPLDAQATFRLVYAPGIMALDLLKAGLGWVGFLVIAGLLFVVPGWALLAWLLRDGRIAWAEMLGLAVGVSLALYPVLILWTNLVGLQLGALYVWLPVACGLVALIWRYRTWRPRKGWDTVRQWACSETFWPDLVLLGVLALVFSARLLVIRSLEAPMWGDSYQHTMIAQLLVDNGGLFDSWVPYAELDRFTYHFGFHSAVAALTWLTGVTAVTATLWIGQLLNGLAVLAVYPLAVRVSGSRWGGTFAVLLAGLLSPMPMFYTNWGRYTQLAGLVILPVAVWLTWEAVERPQRHLLLLTLVALVVGGLALTHYRVLIFYAAFMLALVLVSVHWSTLQEILLRLGWIAVGAGVLFLPWLTNATGANFFHIFQLQLTKPSAQLSTFDKSSNAVGSLETYLAPIWWLTMALGLGVGMWRRQRGVLLIGLWWFLLLIATNPAWLSLPGSGIISNFALFITAYLPAGLLGGALFGCLTQSLAERQWTSVLFVSIVLCLGLWGTSERIGDLDPASHALVTRPDVRAATWINENTPAEAKFLVNYFFAYGDYVIVGADGGWWLPLLAERQNTVPPLNYGNELGVNSAYRQRTEGLARQVKEMGVDDPAVLDLLDDEGVTHVYIGQQQGRVNYSGPHILDPETLLKSPDYRLVYHQDRVWIFELVHKH